MNLFHRLISEMNSTISHLYFFLPLPILYITNSLHYQLFHVEFSVEKKNHNTFRLQTYMYYFYAFQSTDSPVFLPVSALIHQHYCHSINISKNDKDEGQT